MNINDVRYVTRIFINVTKKRIQELYMKKLYLQCLISNFFYLIRIIAIVLIFFFYGLEYDFLLFYYTYTCSNNKCNKSFRSIDINYLDKFKEDMKSNVQYRILIFLFFFFFITFALNVNVYHIVSFFQKKGYITQAI